VYYTCYSPTLTVIVISNDGIKKKNGWAAGRLATAPRTPTLLVIAVSRRLGHAANFRPVRVRSGLTGWTTDWARSVTIKDVLNHFLPFLILYPIHPTSSNMVASALARIAKASAPTRALSTSVLATSTARAALAATPLARVVRKNGVYVPQRAASSDEGVQTMVGRPMRGGGRHVQQGNV
jgi:hypothetical protein